MTRKTLVLVLSLVLIGTFAFSLAGCAPEEPANNAEWPVWDLRDGDYRGHFDDREHNVSVQITLENEEIVDVSLRWQQYDEVVYDTEDPDIPEDYELFTEEQIKGIAEQHETALEYLIGAQGKEEIVERLQHMEGNPQGTPLEEVIEPQEVDGFTGATIRSNKLGSAVRDAFNRGLYRE